MTHPTEEVRPHKLQPTQVQSHVEKLQQMIDSLKKFPDDGRAVDSIMALGYVVQRLSDEAYAPGGVAVTDSTVLADEAISQTQPQSPGVGVDGEPLASFSPPAFGKDGGFA